MRHSIFRLSSRFLLLAVGVSAPACTPDSAATASDVRLTVDAVVDLTDSQRISSEARPQAVAVTGGRAYVALSNLRRTSTGSLASAGPGWVVEIETNPAPSVRRWIPLQLDDGNRCENPGSLAPSADGRSLWVGCPGDYAGRGSVGRVDLETSSFVQNIPIDGAPGPVAVHDGVVWAGDLLAGRVWRLDPRGGVPSSMDLCPASPAPFEMVGAVLVAGQRGWAACFGADSLAEWDPATGQPTGRVVAVGDGPTALAGDSSIVWALDGLSDTLTQVDAAVPRVVSTSPTGRIPAGVTLKDGRLAVTNSGDGTLTVYRVDGTTVRPQASVDLKDPQRGTTYPWGVAADDTGYWVTLNGADRVVHVRQDVLSDSAQGEP